MRPLLLRALVRLRDVVSELEQTGTEPPGDDSDLVFALGKPSSALAETLVGDELELLEVSDRPDGMASARDTAA
jgi:hypothetical protein